MQPSAELDPNSGLLTKAYMAAMIVIGSIVMIFAAVRLPVATFDLNFAVIALSTVVLGPKILLKIPSFKSHIAVSDTFIFLTLLLYGGAAAVLLAAAEAFVSSRRFCKTWRSVFFNVCILALSTATVWWVLEYWALHPAAELRAADGHAGDFLTALAIIALVQFLVNTLLAAMHDALKNAAPLWAVWKDRYVWSIFTYLTGAATAGFLTLLFDRVGFVAVLLAIPIMTLVFLAYRVYMENLEMSAREAQQASKHAEDLKLRSIALEESEQRFKSAFNFAPIGIALIGPDGHCLRANNALCKILGYSQEEFQAMELQSLIHPTDLRGALIEIRKVSRGELSNCQMEHRFIDRQRRIVWASWSLSAAGDAKKGANLIFQMQDISDKKKVEEKLHYEATHDPLTGLPNRLYFTQRLAAALAKKAREPKYHISVLFIDLDRFKFVNDSLGHVAGDQMLVSIAERLRESMRPPDIVARLGGDEFVILVEGRFYNEEASQIAERIHRQFAKPFNVGGREVYSSASIGILHAGPNHTNPEDMMRDADTAMYQAKRSGKARHEVFDEQMHTAAKETLQLETDLRIAIKNEELDVLYQPIYRLSDMGIVGVESLARWTHEELGVISPDKFIQLAEEIGWINELGEMILRKATTEMGPLFATPGRQECFKLSVNVSSEQFGRHEMVPRIKKILDETGFPASCLKLEITESVIIAYQERAIEMLHHLRGLGIDVDIDDFGTGYSNLSYLVRLPISTLKIDRSFVSPLTEDSANIEIVKTILSLARNLGLKVVAEGIETANQLEILRALGCERGQGYHFARPMTRGELFEFLADEKPAEGVPQAIDEVSILSVVQ